MIDFYYQLRQRMVETMQVSLKQIRQVLGFGVQEFGDLIGLTRQTINNLETQKNKMSSIQYIAICAVIDNCLKDKPELLPILSTILCSNEDENHGNIFETIENGSLLKKWFLCFPDESKILRFGNLAPEYSRSWSAFSCQSVSPSLPVRTSLTRSVPPVSFRCVSRAPCESRVILNTLAPKSAGYTGRGA